MINDKYGADIILPDESFKEIDIDPQIFADDESMRLVNGKKRREERDAAIRFFEGSDHVEVQSNGSYIGNIKVNAKAFTKKQVRLIKKAIITGVLTITVIVVSVTAASNFFEKYVEKNQQFSEYVMSAIKENPDWDYYDFLIISSINQAEKDIERTPFTTAKQHARASLNDLITLKGQIAEAKKRNDLEELAGLYDRALDVIIIDLSIIPTEYVQEYRDFKPNSDHSRA